MKIISLFTLSLLAFTNAFSQYIDSLKVDQEILSFLNSLNKRLNTEIIYEFSFASIEELDKLSDCNDLPVKEEYKNWYKIDFNNDSQTDLFVRGAIKTSNSYSLHNFAIIDRGENNFSLIEIPNYWNPYCSFALPITQNNQNLIILYQHKRPSTNEEFEYENKFKKIFHIDTLIFKFNGFIEINNDLSFSKVQSISFEESDGFIYPGFNMSIDSSGNIIYKFSNEQYSNYLSDEEKKQIFDLLNYLPLKKLNEYYQLGHPHQSTGYLKIKFSDGSIKEIKDLGLMGTNGLSLLYHLLDSLRTSKKWEK